MIKACPKDKDLILDLLTYAFEENLSVKDVVKSGGNNWENIYALMNYAYNICSVYGDIFLSEDKKACALVLFPDQKRNTIKTRFWELKLVLGGIGVSNVNKVLTRQKFLDPILPHTPNQPPMYLWLLGVKPENQFLGAGTALLKDLLEYSQEKGRAIYLRTSVDRNVDFYKKFGFQVYKKIDVGYPLNFLWKSVSVKQQIA